MLNSKYNTILILKFLNTKHIKYIKMQPIIVPITFLYFNDILEIFKAYTPLSIIEINSAIKVVNAAAFCLPYGIKIKLNKILDTAAIIVTTKTFFSFLHGIRIQSVKNQLNTLNNKA